jgi:hypothetical protein
MRIGTIAFYGFLLMGWALTLYVSVHAISAMGVNAAGQFFIGDMSFPWRAQFNTDFAMHLLLAAAWMIYRSKSWVVGLICGVLAINLGAIFTFAYLLVVSIRAKGDMRKVLLGAQA